MIMEAACGLYNDNTGLCETLLRSQLIALFRRLSPAIEKESQEHDHPPYAYPETPYAPPYA